MTIMVGKREKKSVMMFPEKLLISSSSKKVVSLYLKEDDHASYIAL